MEKIYANLIIKGKKQIDEVPVKKQEVVKSILIGMGYPELAESENVVK